VIAAGRVRDGRLGLDYGRDVIDTTRPYLRPAGRSVARIENAALDLIELDARGFAQTALRFLEGSGRILRPPTPAMAGPTTPELVAAWHRMSEHAAAVAFDDEAFASPLLRAGLFDLLVTGLLTTFPLTVEVHSPAAMQIRSSALRRALAYIEDHLAEPMDLVAIAAAARVSIRGLQAAFRRQLGVTPMEHVRLRRLAAAHEELVRSDPGDGVTVAAVARRWGFAHLSRFAEQYRETYHESPSQTLHR
jgi:AraC-like DNA-binding protein